MIEYCDGESGEPLLRLTRDQALGCSGQGSQDDSVEATLPHVTFLVDAKALRRHLKGYGAWDDLSECSEDTLKMRTLWIAACDIREEPNRYVEE